MKQRKDESTMFGYLRGVTDQLCKIEPEGREAVKKHIETLDRFSGVLHDAMELDSAEIQHEEDFERLINRIQERIEEMAEKLEIYKDETEESEENYPEELLIDEINMEICGVVRKLANIELEVFRIQKKLKLSSNKSFRCLVGEDLNKLLSMIGSVELCAGGVVLRVESKMKGYFNE
jgi:hypothetical protein